MIIGWIKTQNIGSIHIFMKNHPVIYGKLCPKCVPTFPMRSSEKLWEHGINGISWHCGWLRSPVLGWFLPPINWWISQPSTLCPMPLLGHGCKAFRIGCQQCNEICRFLDLEEWSGSAGDGLGRFSLDPVVFI